MFVIIKKKKKQDPKKLISSYLQNELLKKATSKALPIIT